MKALENTAQTTHKVILEQRTKLQVSGVSDVEGFNEESVTAATPLGVMTVRGRGLKVDRISVETGDMVVTGEIVSIAYSDTVPRHAGIFAKIFK